MLLNRDSLNKNRPLSYFVPDLKHTRRHRVYNYGYRHVTMSNSGVLESCHQRVQLQPFDSSNYSLHFTTCPNWLRVNSINNADITIFPFVIDSPLMSTDQHELRETREDAQSQQLVINNQILRDHRDLIEATKTLVSSKSTTLKPMVVMQSGDGCIPFHLRDCSINFLHHVSPDSNLAKTDFSKLAISNLPYITELSDIPSVYDRYTAPYLSFRGGVTSNVRRAMLQVASIEVNETGLDDVVRIETYQGYFNDTFTRVCGQEELEDIYQKELQECLMTLCPPGNGLATLRTYEAIANGSIPAIRPNNNCLSLTEYTRPFLPRQGYTIFHVPNTIGYSHSYTSTFMASYHALLKNEGIEIYLSEGIHHFSIYGAIRVARILKEKKDKEFINRLLVILNTMQSNNYLLAQSCSSPAKVGKILHSQVTQAYELMLQINDPANLKVQREFPGLTLRQQSVPK